MNEKATSVAQPISATFVSYAPSAYRDDVSLLPASGTARSNIVARDAGGEGGLIELDRPSRGSTADETPDENLADLATSETDDSAQDVGVTDKPFGQRTDDPGQSDVEPQADVIDTTLASEPVLVFADAEGGLVFFQDAGTFDDADAGVDAATETASTQASLGMTEIPMDAAVRLYQAFETMAEPANLDLFDATEPVTVPVCDPPKSSSSSPSPAELRRPSAAASGSQTIVVGLVAVGASLRRVRQQQRRRIVERFMWLD